LGAWDTALKAINRDTLPPTDPRSATNHLRVYTDDPDSLVVVGFVGTAPPPLAGSGWRGAVGS